MNYQPEGSILSHVVTLTGYTFNLRDSSLSWTFKNSYSDSVGENGFFTMPFEYFNYVYAAISPVLKNDTVLITNCRDEDHDSLFFWGVGPKPDSCNCSDIEDCDDSNPFVGGYDQNYNCTCIFEMDSVSHHISSDTVWADSTYVNFDILIDSGATLTINSFAAFAPEAMITVLPGARLILDSAYLTKVCPELWEGIEVWGSDTVQYQSEYFGRVDIRNNSIIEFAETGIANHCKRCSYNSMQSGGIILAENSTFRNNQTDILLAPFKNLWYGNELPYVGVFINCHFQTTEDFYPEFEPKSHVEMKDVYGVRFFGCIFENSDSTSYVPYSMRGTGISGIDVHFSLEKYCNVQGIEPCPHQNLIQCEFNKLEYGIKSLNSVSRRTLNIQDVIFNYNQTAISLSGIDYASVLSNEVNCKRIAGLKENQFAGGLFLEGCTGYHIEGNRFYTYLFDEGLAYGIGVKNSGPDDNEIYNNEFYNFDIGIIAVGENRGRESGLCLKCNDMANAGNDFFVVELDNPPSGVYQGINFYQGNPNDSISADAPAGNIFTRFPDPADTTNLKNYNYLNNAEYIWYVHHFSEDYQVKPLVDNYTKETIELKGWSFLGYEKSTACPSGLGGGGNLKNYYSPRITINEADIQLNILKNQLNDLIDEGNTEAMNIEVMTSMPDDGLEIRQMLLDASPFLSDTVLKQAIYKEDVLPNAMIRDILEANPQSAKSDEILNTLDSRIDPIPDYMMEQIMLGKKYLGAKEVIESEIQNWQHIRSKAKADLMREFMLDTTMVNPYDSVIEFLESESDLESKYNLALAQWKNFDLTEAWTTLNTIPAQFTLNDRQILDHENCLDYFGVLQTLVDSSWSINQMDSISVSWLLCMEESGNRRIAALARGLLVKGGFYKYIETINIPEITKASLVQSDQNDDIKKTREEDKLWLFPNPAGDYVIAYYNLDPIYRFGEINLLDLRGGVLRSYHIKSGINQLVIDLNIYPNGLYMISLNSRNQIIESKKLSKGGH